MANFEGFLNDLERQNKSEATIKLYRSSWERFKRWFTDNALTGDILATPEQATQKDISLFKKWATNIYKPNTVRTTLTQLKTYFNWLVEHGELPDNPVQHIDPVKVAKLPPKWLNQKEQNSIVRTVRKHVGLRDLTIVTFLLHTGVRVQELCDIRLSDITFSDRKGKVIIRKGKHNRYREIPLNKDVRQLLKQYLGEFHNSKSEYLFYSQRSPIVTTRAIQHLMEKYRQLTGIEQLSCHSLRHSFCHELVNRKVALDVVARLAGHIKNDGSPNIELTLTYTRPGEDDLQQAVEELSWI